MSGVVPIELGEGCFVDERAFLGYPTGRKIELLPVRIGAFSQIRMGTIVYQSVTIGIRFESGHNIVIREQNIIGDDVSIWNNTTIDYGCVIGSRVKIHCNVYVAQFTTIEDDVFIAPGVQIANDPHPICTKCMQGPTIRRGARIGVSSTLLPHIIIGENALVGSGSVVTKDVPPGMVVAGNPATIRGSVNDLECPFGIVTPYVDGIDVGRRPEWKEVPPLARPVQRPTGRGGK